MVRGARTAYSREEILRAFPPVPQVGRSRKPRKFPKETAAETMARVEAALAYISPDGPRAIGMDGRHGAQASLR